MRTVFTALLVMILASQASAQQVGIRWLHGKDNYNDSVPVAVIPGRSYVGEFKAPAIYDQWWEEVMACSKLSAPKKDRDSMRFYWVYGDYGFTVEGGTDLYAGWSSIWTRQIFLNVDMLLDRRLVEHEMLHFLLWETATPIGKDGHPKLYYVKRCHLLRVA
jgi:hypothetical protein